MLFPGGDGWLYSLEPKTGKLIDNPAGEKLWKREYRKGWEPKV